MSTESHLLRLVKAPAAKECATERVVLHCCVQYHLAGQICAEPRRLWLAMRERQRLPSQPNNLANSV